MDITNSNNFSDKIARLTNQYYSENKKKTFFKNDQKKNFASILFRKLYTYNTGGRFPVICFISESLCCCNCSTVNPCGSLLAFL